MKKSCAKGLTIYMKLNLHEPEGGSTSYILSSGGQTSSAGVYVYRDESGQLCGGVCDGTNQWSVCDGTYEHDAWHSVAFVLAEARKDPSGYALTMYVDGGNPTPGTAGAKVARNIYKSVVVGAPNNALKEYRGNFDIDNLQLFDRAMTAEEVAQLADDCGCQGEVARPASYVAALAARDGAVDIKGGASLEIKMPDGTFLQSASILLPPSFNNSL